MSLFLPLLSEPSQASIWWSAMVRHAWTWPRAPRTAAEQVRLWASQPAPNRQSARPSLSSEQLLLAWSLHADGMPAASSHFSLLIGLLEEASERASRAFFRTLFLGGHWRQVIGALDYAHAQESPSRAWLRWMADTWLATPAAPMPVGRYLCMAYQRAILLSIVTLDAPPRIRDVLWQTNRLNEDCQMLCRLAMALDWPGEDLPALLLSVYRYSMYHYADRISVAPAPPGAQCLNACAKRLALGGRPREVAAPVRAM